MSTHKVSAYTVYPTGFDESPIVDKYHFVITVEDGYSKHGWAIRRSSRRCLNRAGEWVYESSPSERSDEWFAEHRFPEKEALERALAAVEKVQVNGFTFAEFDARARGLRPQREQETSR